VKDIELGPTDYKILRGWRREPFFGPNWWLLLVYFAMFWVLFGLHYVPKGSWLSPVARILTGH
jgi:hypothetical protein